MVFLLVFCHFMIFCDELLVHSGFEIVIGYFSLLSADVVIIVSMYCLDQDILFFGF